MLQAANSDIGLRLLQGSEANAFERNVARKREASLRSRHLLGGSWKSRMAVVAIVTAFPSCWYGR